jgi:hypothetical protein
LLVRHCTNTAVRSTASTCWQRSHICRNVVPSVFGRKLQCQPVRGVNFREECHWSHACSLQASRRGIQWHPRV